MDDFEKCFVLSMAFFVVALLGTLWINHLNEAQFIQAGYTRMALPGSSTTQWVKEIKK